jgi:threonine dehydrogenase-like Zn-dependent dehydrogenase
MTSFRKKGVELLYPGLMVNFKANKDYWKESLDIIASKSLDLRSLTPKHITWEAAVDAFKYYDREK